LETKACLARRSIKRVLDSLNTGSLSETKYFSRPVQSISNKERCFCGSMNEWMNECLTSSVVVSGRWGWPWKHTKRGEKKTRGDLYVRTCVWKLPSTQSNESTRANAEIHS
jgi:hypothetical protein